jgi:hypothetical protein
MSPMNSLRSLGFLLVLAALVAAGGTCVRQRQETSTLRRELELTRTNTVDLARLRAENRRLLERQVSAAELATLRSDHTALPRLRSELEALTKKQPTAIP